MGAGMGQQIVDCGGRTECSECTRVLCSHFIGHKTENGADIGWAASIQGEWKQHPGDAVAVSVKLYKLACVFFFGRGYT